MTCGEAHLAHELSGLFLQNRRNMATRKATSRRPRGRPKKLLVPNRQFSSRLREDFLERLARMSAATGKPQTRLLEEALTQYFESLDDEE